MAAVASFKRMDTEEGAVFEVEPARGSIAQMIGMIFFTFFFLATCVGGLAQSSRTTFSIGVGTMFLFLGSMWTIVMRDRGKRRRVTIVANQERMTVGDQIFLTTDIAELQLDSPAGEVVYRTTPVVVGTGMGGIAMGAASVAAGVGNVALAIGGEIGRRQANRSLSLKLRRKSDSRLAVIAYGLTVDAGRALMNDLIDAMEKMPAYKS